GTARKHPELCSQIGMMAAEGLRHESPDVQKAAIGLLSKYASPIPADLLKALSERVDDVAASQRAGLQKLIAANTSLAEEAPAGPRANDGRPDIKEKPLLQRAQALDRKWRRLAGVDALLSALEKDSDSIPALDLDPLTIPRLDPDRRIKPIEDLDELIDV